MRQARLVPFPARLPQIPEVGLHLCKRGDLPRYVAFLWFLSIDYLVLTRTCGTPRAGIPDSRPLEDGDIINLDVTLFHGGFHGDINATCENPVSLPDPATRKLTQLTGTDPVGSSVSQENLDLIACSRECLDEAIRMCKPGTQFQDVGKVIEEIASKRGFSTNKTYVGHGIHECVSSLSSVAFRVKL